MRRNFLTAFAIAALLVLGVEAHAVQLVNRSFEQGSLNGWDYVGDVSAQTADLGVTPTHGQYAALLTTGSVRDGCQSDFPCGSYSGSSPNTGGSDFLYWLGLSPLMFPLPPDWQAFGASELSGGGRVTGHLGESGIRQSVDLRAGDELRFDWNFVGDYVDGAFALFYPTSGPFWGGSFIQLHFYAPFTNPHPTNMDLATFDPNWCGVNSFFCEWETGWQSSYFVAPSDGEYAVVLGIFNWTDSVYASALWLDNFHVGRASEPGTFALLGLGLAGLAATRRRFASHC